MLAIGKFGTIPERPVQSMPVQSGQQFFMVVNAQKSKIRHNLHHLNYTPPHLALLRTLFSADSDFPSLHSDVNLHITLLSKHYTQCSVVAHRENIVCDVSDRACSWHTVGNIQ